MPCTYDIHQAYTLLILWITLISTALIPIIICYIFIPLSDTDHYLCSISRDCLFVLVILFCLLWFYFVWGEIGCHVHSMNQWIDTWNWLHISRKELLFWDEDKNIFQTLLPKFVRYGYYFSGVPTVLICHEWFTTLLHRDKLIPLMSSSLF